MGPGSYSKFMYYLFLYSGQDGAICVSLQDQTVKRFSISWCSCAQAILIKRRCSLCTAAPVLGVREPLEPSSRVFDVRGNARSFQCLRFQTTCGVTGWGVFKERSSICLFMKHCGGCCDLYRFRGLCSIIFIDAELPSARQWFQVNLSVAVVCAAKECPCYLWLLGSQFLSEPD